MIGIVVVDHRHGIPLDMMLLEQLYASLHLVERRPAVGRTAVLVVKILRPINRDAHKPAILPEELTPFIGQHGAIGLYAVAYPIASAIHALASHRLAVERQRSHQRLTTMPSEQHLGLRLRLNILPRELLQHLVTHRVTRIIGVKTRLLKIVAVFATQVAMSASRLRHHIQRT